MTLLDLLGKVYMTEPQSLDKGYSYEDGSFGTFLPPESPIKVRLRFSDNNHPELNKIIVPADHPLLIAWYNYEVECISFPQKNVVEVQFSGIYCD